MKRERTRRDGAPPCYKCPRGKETGRPSPHLELSTRGWMALQLYYEIKAGFPLPEDALVRRHCGLIEQVLAAISREQANLTPLLALALRRK